MLPNMIRVQSKLSHKQGADDLLIQTANAAEEQKYTWNVCCVLQQSAVCIIILNNKSLITNEINKTYVGCNSHISHYMVCNGIDWVFII